MPQGVEYQWDSSSTYIRQAPFVEQLPTTPLPQQAITSARVLLWLGDMVTTDHISPAGKFEDFHPAGQYLIEHGVEKGDFNSYGARRGNHEVMLRGTFANVRLQNKLVERKGGYTRHFPSQEELTVFDAAQRYAAEQVPLVVLGRALYGSGSSRDWAAKGTSLLGVRAVIATSFERIHRSNLVGMGVLPIELNTEPLPVNGDVEIDITWDELAPAATAYVALRSNGQTQQLTGIIRLDSAREVDYYLHGGILQYVTRTLL